MRRCSFRLVYQYRVGHCKEKMFCVLEIKTVYAKVEECAVNP